MVQVHLLKRYAGPLGNFPSGRTIEVCGVEADILVAAGAAERIDGMKPFVSAEAAAKAAADAAALELAQAAAAAKEGRKETAVEKGGGKREKRDS